MVCYYKKIPVGAKLDNLTSQYGLIQILKESTTFLTIVEPVSICYLLANLTLLLDFGIHPSLQENCHHQIIYSKSDLKIFYSQPNESIVWHYQQTDRVLIKRSLEKF